MATSLRRGDKVKAIVDIKGGMWKWDVKEGTTGTVLSTSSNTAEVSFQSGGFGWPAVDLNGVPMKYLDKI